MDYYGELKQILYLLTKRIITMDQYTKILLTIITFCVVLVTMVIVGAAIVHDHDDGHDYHEYLEHVIERLDEIEEQL